MSYIPNPKELEDEQQSKSKECAIKKNNSAKKAETDEVVRMEMMQPL